MKTFLAARFIFGLTHHLLQRVWISDVRRVKVFKFGRGGPSFDTAVLRLRFETRRFFDRALSKPTQNLHLIVFAIDYQTKVMAMRRPARTQASNTSNNDRIHHTPSVSFQHAWQCA